MKFLVLLLFVSTLQLSAGVYSQEARVSLHLENASFEEVVKVLERTTDYTFLFRDNQVAGIRNLNLAYTDVDIKVVLDACLKGTRLTYRLVDNTIVIQHVVVASVNTLSKFTVKGIVKDKKGELLPGVTIRVKGTTLGFVTNVKGEFDIDLPKRDNLMLIFSFVGYKRQEVPVKNDNKSLAIVLEEDLQTVDEVVVTGIFNKPKESFTGAVTAVSKEEIKAKYFCNSDHKYAAACFYRASLMQKMQYAELDSLVRSYTGMENNNDVRLITQRRDLMRKVAVGVNVPEINLPDVEGKSFALSSLKGKWVLLDFWASWCAPCRREGKHVLELYKKYQQNGFEVLGVSIDQNPDAWKQAIKEDQTPWKHVLDQRSEVAKTFGVSSVPRVFLIDPKGVIVAVNLYGEELEQCLEEIFSK